LNKGEQKVKDIYEGYGFTVVHNGAPDFLCFRRNKDILTPNSFAGCHKDGAMSDIVFVEVKNNYNELRPDQILWRESLERMGYHYRLEYPRSIQLDHKSLITSLRMCECGEHYIFDSYKNDAERFIDRMISYRKLTR
jgi:hypothetical protein